MRAVVMEMPKGWLEDRRNSDASRWDEMWEGVLHMAPSPNLLHQDFAAELFVLLRERWAKPAAGKVYKDVNLTTAADESEWTKNYRVPDLVLLSSDRLHYRRVEYIAGPPLVCVEVRSPNDESYEKLPFYAGLGVPEVWIIDRDTKKPEVFVHDAGGYRSHPADAEAWVRSDALGLRMKHADGKLRVLFDGDAEYAVVPE